MKPKAFFAELIGTFALTFIGVGAVVVGNGGLLGISLAFGLTATTFIYLFGEISGTHINPAVTFGLALNGVIQWVEATFYWIAQCLGGIFAAALLFFIFGGPKNGLGATVLAPGVTPFQGILIEAILTFFLVNAIYFGAIKGYAGKRAGFIIGMTISFDILMGAPLTGASLNPARTLGPAIFTGTLGEFWIYFVGTFLGAALAAGFYRLMTKK